MEQRPILSEKEKIALRNAGETVTRVMTLDGTTAEDVIRQRNVQQFNEQVDAYVEKYSEHSKKLEDYAQQISENIEKIEIMPIGNYVLAKLLDENPFQKIVKDSKSGLILDLGGMKPQYKNTDNGETEEEEQFIKVLVIQEVGPECKWCKPNDVIMATKPSLIPVPFYKQNLQLVNETRVMVVINEGLSERFNKQ